MNNFKLEKLPLKKDIETKNVLKKLNEAHRALAELKGLVSSIPNENILINTLGLQEAKDSSEIENIITTHDDLYKAELNLDGVKSLDAKEEVLFDCNEMAEGDNDFIKSVISVFLEEVPVDLSALEAALESENYEQVYQLAHKIKPNVELLGMVQAHTSALEIETLAKNKTNTSQINSFFIGLKKDVLQVIKELQNDFN